MWGDFGNDFMDVLKVVYQYRLAGRRPGGGGSDLPWCRKGPRGRRGWGDLDYVFRDWASVLELLRDVC